MDTTLFNDFDIEDDSIEIDPTLDLLEELGDEANADKDTNTDGNKKKVVEDDFSTDFDPTKEDIAGDDDEEDKNEEDSAAPQSKKPPVSQSNAPFKKFALALKEEGQFSSIEEKDLENIKSFADLSKIVDKEAERRLAEKEGNLTEKQKEFLGLLREGVPSDYLTKQIAFEDRLERIEEFEVESNEDLQIQLYLANLKAKGFDDAKANKYLEKIRQVDILDEEAKDALVEIKERAVAQRNKVVEDIKKEKQKIEKYVSDAKELIPGITLSKVEKEALLKSISTIQEDDKGNRFDAVVKKKNENPEQFIAKLHYFLSLGLFDEKANLSKLMKVTKTKVAEEFEKTINSDTYTSMGKSNSNNYEEVSVDKGLLSALEML